MVKRGATRWPAHHIGVLMITCALAGCASASGSANQTPAATGAPPQQATVTLAPAATLALTPTLAPTATPAPAPQATIIAVFSDAVTIAPNSGGKASASCPGGEPLLGGGFIVRLANAGGEDGVVPDASYPASGTTWRVTATALADKLSVTAIAVCLRANFAVSTTIAQAANAGGDTAVTCPAGSTLTGGGFRSGGGTNAASRPSGNSWKITTGVPFGGSAAPTVYAICATHGLKAAGVQTATKTVADGSVTANGAGCPSGQYPVGGGYNGYPPSADTFWRVFLNAPETGQGTISSGWMGEVHSGEPASSAFTVYSVCATH